MGRLHFPLHLIFCHNFYKFSIHAEVSLFLWIKWLDVEQQDQGIHMYLFFKAFEIYFPIVLQDG